MSTSEKQTLQDVAARFSGEIASRVMNNALGFSFGMTKMDQSLGKIEKGQIYLIGGFSGVGKSYFAINLINTLLESNEQVKVLVNSTELKDTRYVQRLVCLRMGIWEIDLVNDVAKYQSAVEAEAFKVYTHPKAANVLVYGKQYSMEELQKIVAQEKPDIVIVDYIQEMMIHNEPRVDKKMPALKEAITTMANENDCAVFVLSQVNQSAANKDYKEEFGNAFNWGVDFYNAADVAIKLYRERKEGVSQDTLYAQVLKGRMSGETTFEFSIHPGYKLTTRHYKWMD